MIIGDRDLGGASNPFLAPVAGTDRGDVLVYNAGHIAYPKGAVFRDMPVKFWVRAWQGLGGQAANSFLAVQLFIKQLEELASNPFHNPTYIRWSSTADPTGYNAADPHDGWYEIVDFKPNYASFIPSGWVDCTMKATLIAPGAPRPTQYALFGGRLSTNFTGAGLSLVAFPPNSTGMEASFTRTGAEGAIPLVLAPAANPEPVTLSATVSDWFKGGVHVYDTINTGTNPVPTSGGTFVNANWVEVYGPDHNFIGDCVITNGLQLLLFVVGAVATVAQCYLWNTALAVTNWQNYAKLIYSDNVPSQSTVRSYSLVRVGVEECSLAVNSSSATPQMGTHLIRLQRGRCEVRIGFKPLSQATTTDQSLILQLAITAKIGYNSGKVADNVLSEAAPAVQADYGYGAAFVNSTIYPFILGFLYQNQPGGFQPGLLANNINVNLGDTASLAINAQRSYGFFAIPYGVSGSYSTANLQAEGELGALGTGWSSVADAAASGGNTAKCASGTLTGNTDIFGTLTNAQVAAGTYDVWFRVKVTSNASAVAEMQLKYVNAGNGTSVGTALVTLAPNQVLTIYSWVKAGTVTLPLAVNSTAFDCQTAATLATDWFVDEAVLVPKTLTTDNRGPQDIWQQFINDVTQELVVA